MIPGARDAQGRLYVTSAAPTAASFFKGGVAMTALGQVHITATLPSVFANGLPLLHDGSLCVAAGGTVFGFENGIPFDVAGSIVTTLNLVPTATDPYSNGVRVGAGGVFTTDAVPVVGFAFSDGFSEGFS
jgi:hypothetical protein